MTDNTQVGLKEWCEAFIDGDISAGQFKRVVRIWHNKQTLELLDRLTKKAQFTDYNALSIVRGYSIQWGIEAPAPTGALRIGTREIEKAIEAERNKLKESK